MSKSKTTALLFRNEGAWWLSGFAGDTVPSASFETAQAARAYARARGWSVRRASGCDGYAPVKRDAGWRDAPPDAEGLWLLYGDVEFGTMGGNYTGVFQPEYRYNLVEVRMLGSGLRGVCNGRFVGLTPFDEANRKPGFVGKWRKMELPAPPEIS